MKPFEYFLKQELKKAGHDVSAGMDYLDVVRDEVERAAIRYANQQTSELEAKILWYRHNVLAVEEEKGYDSFFGITTKREGKV